MIWAMGALLFQLHAVPQVVVPSASRAALETIETAAPSPESMPDAATASDQIVSWEPGRLTLTPVTPAAAPAETASTPPALPVAPAIAPAIAPARQPEFAGRIGSGPQKLWLGLAIAQHGAATFDAWSTRRAITKGGARELNPLLKPFAGNGSIYAAVQVAPTLLDLLGRRMMASRHAILRHTWWLPQVLGTAASLAGGMHNMNVH
jgi:hypothetical protein